jgi:hypothetical protein
VTGRAAEFVVYVPLQAKALSLTERVRPELEPPIPQVFRDASHPRVGEEPSGALPRELLELLGDPRLRQLAVPRPLGHRLVFRRRVTE